MARRERDDLIALCRQERVNAYKERVSTTPETKGRLRIGAFILVYFMFSGSLTRSMAQ
jgi:hypothetical protein